MAPKSSNITTIPHRVKNSDRWTQQGHRGGVLWLTGLPGSGKTTLAFELERRLFPKGLRVYALDGDNLRYGLNADLGFAPDDRTENIRRVGEVAALFAGAGIIVITAFISPYRADRARARQAAGENFHEVYLSASVEVCEKRDPKGLYKKARQGKIADFTGVSAPYERPETPELVVDTGALTIEESVRLLEEYVDRVFRLRQE